MSISATDPASPTARPASSGDLFKVLGLIAVAGVALAVLFWSGLENMFSMWNAPEYNHGPMIPFVAIYLLWLRARDISSASLAGSWLGVGFLLVSFAILFVGNRSALFALTQNAFVLALWGLVWAAGGKQGLRLMWVPLVYLFFMVPLPDFLTQKLTANLQLVSSDIGVAVIRAAGVSVYLSGNVIDLGDYKLQVAEACSGMRYLFPLLSFGFLCAVLFRGRWWQRAILLLSTVPITILMNSFRIGVIGILVNRLGIEQAEGFLHDFEGWVIFMACVAVLFTEVWIFARMERQGFLEIFGLDIPQFSALTDMLGSLRPNRTAYAAVALAALAAVLSLTISPPAIQIPERTPLATFPMKLGEFEGREGMVEKVYLDQLQMSDYLTANYRHPAEPSPVDLWIAYYDSQSKGASVHSPKACLPGGGWQIESLTQREVPNVLPDGSGMVVNRVEISLGEDRQLVYYWFPQRGRVVTNEFLVKWYIFQDGLTKNRTDGALVRLTTYVGDRSALPEADARLEGFMRALDPKLAFYLPGANAALRLATPAEVEALEFRPMVAEPVADPVSE